VNDASLPKVIALVGPTASGKTDWSLRLAQKYTGEIISADSRQVYKKMDIGTAKALGEWRWHAGWNGLRRTYYCEDIPHHLIDFLDPGKQFTAAEFRDRAIKYIKLTVKNEHNPIIIGGTGLYISALVDNLHIPRVLPNKKLRIGLEEKTPAELLQLLKNFDPVSAEKIDPYNKRRLIRALEVCILSGKPFSEQQKKGEPMFQFLQIAPEISRELLYERIDTRVDSMIEKGLIKEVEALIKQKYSWELPSMSGVGYRQFKEYLEGKKTLEQTTEDLKRDTRHFARRQLTWFKRDKTIHWCKTYEEAEALVEKFLKK
jgi:tRNA dimethylallyltransferase